MADPRTESCLLMLHDRLTELEKWRASQQRPVLVTSVCGCGKRYEHSSLNSPSACFGCLSRGAK